MIEIYGGTFNLIVVILVIAWVITIRLAFSLGREVGRDDKEKVR